MLEGKELLEKAKLLSKKSEDEIIGNGRQGKTGNRASRGRQAEFKTKVHGNGNLLIGHAYTKKLGLEPGKEFKIDLKKESKAIYLTPLN